MVVLCDRECRHGQMVALGHSVNYSTRTYHHTPLYHAIGYHHHGIITLLHSLGATLNVEDTDYTPLMWACHFSTQTVVHLVALGADVYQTSWDGETALHIAVEVENITAVRVLLQVAPDLVNVTEVNGDVPLVRPCSFGGSNPELVKVLLEYGADVNLFDVNDEQTPVHLAAAAGNREVIELLFQANADVNALDFQALTPLHLAMVNEQQEMVDMLLKAGAQVEVVREDDGETALFFACRHGHMKMFTVLTPYLQLHDIYRKNTGDVSPLDLVEHFRHDQIAEILRCIIFEKTSVRGIIRLALEQLPRDG